MINGEIDWRQYRQASSNGDTFFEVRIQQLSTEFFEDSVQSRHENGTLEIDSNRGTYSLNVNADGDLDDESRR